MCRASDRRTRRLGVQSQPCSMIAVRSNGEGSDRKNFQYVDAMICFVAFSINCVVTTAR